MGNRRHYKFRVDGYVPPKKGMDLSMFGKPGEAERIVALRKAAVVAMNGEPPLCKDISIYLVVHVGKTNDRMTGDLDNFITGICDGLMAALPNAKIALIFERPEYLDIYPTKAIGIVDDCQVMEIYARKVVGDKGKPLYEVTLEGI